MVKVISITHKGNFKRTDRFFKHLYNFEIMKILNGYGKKGVDLLSSATPVKTGLTSKSWGYEIEKRKGTYIIHFTNSNVQNGIPIALILQYGHGTGTGGYVKGVDYINPPLKELFEELASEAWKEVTKL